MVRQSVRCIAMASVATVFLVLPLAAAASPGGNGLPGNASKAFAAASAAPAALVPGLVGPQHMLDPALAKGDQASWRLSFMAQLEQTGALAPGTTARLARLHAAALANAGGNAATTSLGPPLQMYEDSYPICDVDKDGRNEIVQNMYNLVSLTTEVRVLDGATGATKWIEYDSYWFPSLGRTPQAGLIHDRPGAPEPDRSHQRAQNFFPEADLNGDGDCDLLYVTFVFEGSRGLVGVVEVTLTAVNARTSFSTIWSQSQESTYLFLQDPLGVCGVGEVTNFPTALLAFESPTGPKFVYQSTDVHQQACQDPITGYNVVNYWIGEHFQLHDARTGDQYWQRDLNYTSPGHCTPSPQTPFPSCSRTNLTYLSGATDVAGDREPELILDQLWFSNPQSNAAEQDNPIDGSPMSRYGRGMDMLALAGELGGTGDTLWTAVVWDDGFARANPPVTEESFEELVWTDAQVLPDLNGDGHADPVALVLTQEGAEQTDYNGNFRTHFVPLDGATGHLLWGNQVKYQGWGFMQSLRPANHTDLVAIGTVDLPTPPPPPGQGMPQAFPIKQVRLAALHAADGTPAWTYQEQFAQDSYISYDLALEQYHDALAPIDLNGDGVLDPVTPNQYIAPQDDTQVMLSTARSAYDVLDGATGGPLRHFETFGSNGYLVDCGTDGYTLVAGYSQHLEVIRVAANGTQMWSIPIWIDPSTTSASYGMELTFLAGRCRDLADGRTMVGMNAGLASYRRGTEIMPLFGFPHGPDTPLANATSASGPHLATRTTQVDAAGIWFSPDVLAKKGLLEAAQALLRPVPPPTTGQRLGWGLVPAVPGLMLGVSAGLVRNRKVPKIPKVAKRKLPDLYAEDP